MKDEIFAIGLGVFSRLAPHRAKPFPLPMVNALQGVVQCDSNGLGGPTGGAKRSYLPSLSHCC
jgi:hypothetical protein